MSSGTMSPDAIRHAFHTFRQYMRDLVEAAPVDQASIATRYSVFTTKLRLLVNFAEKDDVMRWVTQALHARATDPRAWYAALSAGEPLPAPSTPAGVLAHQYAVLHGIKNGWLENRAVVSMAYGGAGDYTDAFARFREDAVVGLGRRFDALLGAIEAGLGAGDCLLDAAIEAGLDGLDRAARAAAAPAPAAKAPRGAAKAAGRAKKGAAKAAGKPGKASKPGKAKAAKAAGAKAKASAMGAAKGKAAKAKPAKAKPAKAKPAKGKPAKATRAK